MRDVAGRAGGADVSFYGGYLMYLSIMVPVRIGSPELSQQKKRIKHQVTRANSIMNINIFTS